jgi:hypothetical protein
VSERDVVSRLSHRLCSELPAEPLRDELLSASIMLVPCVESPESGSSRATGKERSTGRRGRPPRRDFWYSQSLSSAAQRLQAGNVASHLTLRERHWMHASATRLTDRLVDKLKERLAISFHMSESSREATYTWLSSVRHLAEPAFAAGLEKAMAGLQTVKVCETTSY